MNASTKRDYSIVAAYVFCAAATALIAWAIIAGSRYAGSKMGRDIELTLVAPIALMFCVHGAYFTIASFRRQPKRALSIVAALVNGIALVGITTLLVRDAAFGSIVVGLFLGITSSLIHGSPTDSRSIA